MTATLVVYLPLFSYVVGALLLFGIGAFVGWSVHDWAVAAKRLPYPSGDHYARHYRREAERPTEPTTEPVDPPVAVWWQLGGVLGQGADARGSDGVHDGPVEPHREAA